ncbi:class I SAM-dependent methyltransferase [Aestuariibius insulae]|uniref:class I SAM-dependent methyltransferase n=1 Tax=Aestuariibius insulae TaxID=2058287 RepID=UPI00345E73A0
MTSRLSLAAEDGLFDASDAATVIFGARASDDLTSFDPSKTTVVQGMWPDHKALLQRGFETVVDAPDTADIAVVLLPRSKGLARHWIAQAMQIAKSRVIVDGQKTDGIDSLARELRTMGTVIDSFAKAHGKTVVLEPGAALPGWLDPAPRKTTTGFYTRQGVFSADRIDPGSRLFAAALPRLVGHVVDLGAGWGYLSHHILVQNSVSILDLVEADKSALDCAKLNVPDPRASFHWADARDWRPSGAVDVVVSNPPFHTGRKAEPDLGIAFITSAARILAPKGSLFLVANRHLPYEAALVEHFKDVEEIDGDPAYKILRGTRPRR